MSRTMRDRRWLVALLVVAAAVAAGGGAAWNGGLFHAPPVEHNLQGTPERQVAERRTEHAAFTEMYSTHVVRELYAAPRESFARLLIRAGATQPEAGAALASMGAVYDPSRLQPGQAINLFFEQAGAEQPRFAGLAFRPDPGGSITLSRTFEGGFIAREFRIPLTFEIARINAMVGDDLYTSAIQLGATDREVAALADACGYELDFQRDVRPTDRFEIVFERIYNEDGATLRTGKTLFVSIDTRLGTRLFFAFQAPGESRPGWYDSIGRSARRFLMMTPINGARVSSAFGMRGHPILGYSSLHRGVDFAAPSGTPVVAAGNGVVVRKSWQGDYGNYIRLRHNDGYETAYAHLSGYAGGVFPGASVRQGQTIGFVGSTGRSTGPHLHYEVLYRGLAVNPAGLRMSTARNLTNQDLALFRAEVERIDTLRAELWRGHTRVRLTDLAARTLDAAAARGSIRPQ